MWRGNVSNGAAANCHADKRAVWAKRRAHERCAALERSVRIPSSPRVDAVDDHADAHGLDLVARFAIREHAMGVQQAVPLALDA